MENYNWESREEESYKYSLEDLNLGDGFIDFKNINKLSTGEQGDIFIKTKEGFINANTKIIAEVPFKYAYKLYNILL